MDLQQSSVISFLFFLLRGVGFPSVIHDYKRSSGGLCVYEVIKQKVVLHHRCINLLMPWFQKQNIHFQEEIEAPR